jgi:hypothetical protein
MTDTYVDKQAFAAQERARAEQELQQRRQYDAAVQQHNKNLNDIVQIGKQHYAGFEDSVQTVADALGVEQATQLGGNVAAFDNPHGILDYMGTKMSETELKRFGRLPMTRQIVELSRIEARLNHNQPVYTTDAPQYQVDGVKSGRMSRDNFNSAASDLLSDEQYSREWDRHNRRERD